MRVSFSESDSDQLRVTQQNMQPVPQTPGIKDWNSYYGHLDRFEMYMYINFVEQKVTLHLYSPPMDSRVFVTFQQPVSYSSG